VGYYVNNIYDNEEMNLNLPENVQIDRVVRNILSDKPRITKFNINWDQEVSVIPSYNNYNYMFDEGKKLVKIFKIISSIMEQGTKTRIYLLTQEPS
jgi:hypothetical protein